MNLDWSKLDPSDHPAIFAALLEAHGLERFDPAIHDDPGSLESSLREHHRHRADSLISLARSWARGPMAFIYFDYCIHDSFGAHAHFCSHNNCGYICVHTGTIYLIYDLFYRLLAHPLLFGYILDPTSESERQPFHSQGLSRNWKELLDRRPPHAAKLRDIQPRDVRRQRFAERLAEIAIDYLILHECCHILRGHCQLLCPVGFLFESPLTAESPYEVSEDEALTFQAVEHDADSFATYNTFTT